MSEARVDYCSLIVRPNWGKSRSSFQLFGRAGEETGRGHRYKSLDQRYGPHGKLIGHNLAGQVGGAEVGARLDGAPQDPGEGLLWAARALKGRGLRLRAGMIVLCGTHLPPHAITAPGQVLVEMAGFGTVGFSVV